MKILSNFCIFFVRIYQLCLSPFKAPCCRFHPTCSQYAKEALEKHSFFKAFALILKRILRCHPWGGSGYDPVPPVKMKERNKNEK